jgi:FKBP-type peptidyl-prolyl cis-trans isomerase
MKSKIPVITFAALGLLAFGTAAQDRTVLKDQNDRISYSIGVNVGTGLKQQTQQQGLTINPEILVSGIKDAFSGGKTQLTEQEVRDTLMALQKDMVGKQSELGEKNKKEGEAFLAENKKKPGVKTMPNGLQYQVLAEGKGPKPKVTDTVKVNYKGTFISGTEFDSSDKHGPVTFALNHVIKGWTEGLQLMSVGSKYRLFVPSDLAYGPQGADSLIGPNATLIFDVELLGIEPAPKT